MNTISRDELRCLLGTGRVTLIEALATASYAAAFVRVGYTDVRVYPGGKSDWADAGLSFMGTRADTADAVA